MAASLFSSKVITMGTVIAVFLSTSDEMLPIMISEQAETSLVLKIILFKVIDQVKQEFEEETEE